MQFKSLTGNEDLNVHFMFTRNALIIYDIDSLRILKHIKKCLYLLELKIHVQINCLKDGKRRHETDLIVLLSQWLKVCYLK